MVVYVDSVRTANGTVNDVFSTSFGNWVGSGLLYVTGFTFTWVDGLPPPDAG
jgi:hypothetical protein